VGRGALGEALGAWMAGDMAVAGQQQGGRPPAPSLCCCRWLCGVVCLAW
jgi:hypothetical protein